jgi:ABC-type dipeptide/oligopeptide/nickel transport system permease subunit
LFSLLVILLLVLVALLAQWLAPHDVYVWDLKKANLPPMWDRSPSQPPAPLYPLGTDRYGRDILSRLILGTRTAVALALVAVPLAAVLGTLIGLVAAYRGGRFDTGTVLVADILQSLPGIMFVVIIILIFRTRTAPTWLNGLLTLVAGFVLVSWVSLARLVRVSALQVKSRLFVEAAVATGATPWRVITRHLLPNVQHVTLVWIINSIPAIILLEAVLGYVGVGITAAVDGSEFSVVSYGGLFFSGRSAMQRNPLMLVLPTLCILLISMSFILLADYLDEPAQR